MGGWSRRRDSSSSQLRFVPEGPRPVRSGPWVGSVTDLYPPVSYVTRRTVSLSRSPRRSLSGWDGTGAGGQVSEPVIYGPGSEVGGLHGSGCIDEVPGVPVVGTGVSVVLSLDLGPGKTRYGPSPIEIEGKDLQVTEGRCHRATVTDVWDRWESVPKGPFPRRWGSPNEPVEQGLRPNPGIRIGPVLCVTAPGGRKGTGNQPGALRPLYCCS